jgi:hypothetical protein
MSFFSILAGRGRGTRTRTKLLIRSHLRLDEFGCPSSSKRKRERIMYALQDFKHKTHTLYYVYMSYTQYQSICVQNSVSTIGALFYPRKHKVCENASVVSADAIPDASTSSSFPWISLIPATISSTHRVLVLVLFSTVYLVLYCTSSLSIRALYSTVPGTSTYIYCLSVGGGWCRGYEV